MDVSKLVGTFSPSIIGRGVPVSRKSFRAAWSALRSFSRRGISWLRLCQAEKLDRSALILLVVYANSGSVMLEPLSVVLSNLVTTCLL